MTRINDLILELCPEGVPFSPLGDLCTFGRGNWIKAELLSPGQIPVVTSAREISNFHDESNRQGETVVVASSGAYAGFVTFWNQPIWLSNAFSVDAKSSSTLKPKYLYFVLKNMQIKIHEFASTGGVPNIYGTDIENIPIPVPPIPVQEEIVRILDIFIHLESELEAELEARRKQFEYYRDKILTFKEQSG